MEESLVRNVEGLRVLDSAEGYGSSTSILGALALILGVSLYVALGSIAALLVAVLGAMILFASSLAFWALHRKLVQG